MEDQASDCSLSFLCKRAHVSKNANDFETQRRRMVERTTGERANRKALVGIKQVHINLCVCVWIPFDQFGREVVERQQERLRGAS